MFLNWAVLYGTAVAAVTSAAWTLAFFYRESTDIRDQLETIVLLSALVAGPVIVFTAEHLVFSIWMAIQILTGLYWVHTTGKLKRPSVQLSPKGVMQWLLFAVYVVLTFYTYFGAFMCVAFAPGLLEIKLVNKRIRWALAFSGMIGAALWSSSISDRVVVGVMVGSFIFSVLTDQVDDSANVGGNEHAKQD